MNQERSSALPGSDQSLSAKDNVLETGASVAQTFGPVKQICAHLNAFHVYAADSKRCVEANHYCSHISPDVRQCLIYDSTESNARLIGVEYMITPKLYESLDAEERKLWHSHVYEVKSGMLIMPGPQALPTTAWELAENKEMEEVIGLYGKTYHLWQTDRGDKLPLGVPELMMSFTDAEQCQEPGTKGMVDDRNERYGINQEQKAQKREYIQDPQIHADADSMWNSHQPI